MWGEPVPLGLLSLLIKERRLNIKNGSAQSGDTERSNGEGKGGKGEGKTHRFESSCGSKETKGILMSTSLEWNKRDYVKAPEHVQEKIRRKTTEFCESKKLEGKKAQKVVADYAVWMFERGDIVGDAGDVAKQAFADHKMFTDPRRQPVGRKVFYIRSVPWHKEERKVAKG